MRPLGVVVSDPGIHHGLRFFDRGERLHLVQEVRAECALAYANPDTLGIDAAVFRELIDAVWADLKADVVFLFTTRSSGTPFTGKPRLRAIRP